MGECPPWYRTVVAARYLGVAPWDLEGQPLRWIGYAEAAAVAENKAEQNVRKTQPKP